MRLFAALGGVMLGLVLFTIGYLMTLGNAEPGYDRGFVLGIAALVGLPILYWLKADRRLPRWPSRVLFLAMIAALALCWLPLLQSEAMRARYAGALTVFSAVWVVAALPFLRAGIRHRPR